ncbi:hypothetical protein BGX38DRAFT_54294 [Terfezia claveryi]|nr:hypothetical protein BGX38DRAFT_54294 [Terfezia claveryi]
MQPDNLWSGKSDFFGEYTRSVKPLAVPTLDNSPKYKTPAPMQLPTPGPTPRVELPSIIKKRSGGIIMREDAVTIGAEAKGKK